jgi:adenylate kinase
VLDGFPRTVPQAEALDALVESRRDGPLVVVDVTVPEEELVRRLASRRVCGTCGTTPDATVGAWQECPKCGGELGLRVDDSPNVVLERLRVYERSTRPVLDYYRGRTTFRVVEGAQAPEVVARDLASVIDEARSYARAARAISRSGHSGHE